MKVKWKMTYPAKIPPQVLRTIHRILTQNRQHIHVSFFFNNQQIPNDYVTTLSSKANHLEHTNAGNYQFRVVVSFDEKINDGISDYAAGDYISEYHVTVQ